MLACRGPECVMGPCTASHCCCLPRPPLCAMCHFQVLLTLLVGSICHRGAVYGSPLLLSQSRNQAHGPPVPTPSCCCQVQSVSWVPVRPPIAAVSIATLCRCATFRSPHTAGGFHFL
ncbi:unnamed protein product, partial [Staurois parvus]